MAPCHRVRGSRLCPNGKRKRRKGIASRSRASPRHCRASFHHLFCLARSAARSCERDDPAEGSSRKRFPLSLAQGSGDYRVDAMDVASKKLQVLRSRTFNPSEVAASGARDACSMARSQVPISARSAEVRSRPSNPIENLLAPGQSHLSAGASRHRQNSSVGGSLSISISHTGERALSRACEITKIPCFRRVGVSNVRLNFNRPFENVPQ
jgi:hypothetical protein